MTASLGRGSRGPGPSAAGARGPEVPLRAGCNDVRRATCAVSVAAAGERASTTNSGLALSLRGRAVAPPPRSWTTSNATTGAAQAAKPRGPNHQPVRDSIRRGRSVQEALIGMRARTSSVRGESRRWSAKVVGSASSGRGAGCATLPIGVRHRRRGLVSTNDSAEATEPGADRWRRTREPTARAAELRASRAARALGAHRGRRPRVWFAIRGVAYGAVR